MIERNRKIKSGMVFKNYKELCAYLGEPVKTGKSKQLQVAEWERYFSYRRNGQKFTIIEVYENPIPKINKRHANHDLMAKYLKLMCCPSPEFYSFTTWFCDELEIFNKETYNVVYYSAEQTKAYCENNGIENFRLFTKYVFLAKSELKKLFLATLEYMKNKNIANYKNGHKFFYQLSESLNGYVATDVINETVMRNETDICEAMSQEHNFNGKLQGRQNLFIIYGNKELQKEFDDRKIELLMDDEVALKKLNNELKRSYDHSFCKIDLDHPLISYFQCANISSIANNHFDEDDDYDENEIISAKSEINDLIKTRVRERLKKYHYVDKRYNEIVYPFARNCDEDIERIEKMLFRPCNNLFDEDDEEYEMFKNLSKLNPQKSIDGFYYIENCWTNGELETLPFLRGDTLEELQSNSDCNHSLPDS